MKRYLLFIMLSIVSTLIAQIDYNTQIQPIFDNNCTNCHGGSGGLNLSNYSNLMAGGNEGPSINPYDHTTSILYDRITRSESESGDMPPSGSLTQSEKDLIATWIDQGALESPTSSVGCTDPNAYNCLDDDGENYTFEIGDLTYVNGCNYGLNDFSEIEYIGGCESGPCSGYYNPAATEDDGSCDYFQSPSYEQVEFTIEDSGINIDWSSFTAPENAIINGFILQRCTSNCVFITGMPFPWPNGSGIGYTETSFFDEFDWQESLSTCDNCNGEVKYSINVHYSNAESFGMAMGVYYVAPPLECVELGDTNGDGGYNVLDIVILANCVLSANCLDIEHGCAADMNGDEGFNVLDVVILANCVLAGNCGS